MPLNLLMLDMYYKLILFQEVRTLLCQPLVQLIQVCFQSCINEFNGHQLVWFQVLIFFVRYKADNIEIDCRSVFFMSMEFDSVFFCSCWFGNLCWGTCTKTWYWIQCMSSWHLFSFLYCNKLVYTFNYLFLNIYSLHFSMKIRRIRLWIVIITTTLLPLCRWL